MLELLQQADLVLNACGRPVPPPGYRWVDLPRVIPYQRVLAADVAQITDRVQNIANTVFLCRGISVSTSHAAYRIRWPNGRVMESQISLGNPTGVGQVQLALLPEVPLDPQGQIAITLNSTLGGSVDDDTTTILFYGVLRYLLKATGKEPPFVQMTVSQAPRVRRGPNQNIMCPEWYLGEQCTPETPEGYWDEPFTLFSDPVVVAVGEEVSDFPVQIPGDCDSFVVKRWSFAITQDIGILTGQPIVGWRLADGYSITGGDMIPSLAFNTQARPSNYPGVVFPSLAVPGGARMFLDVGDEDGTGAGNFTTVVRFDGVKRRKLT